MCLVVLTIVVLTTVPLQRGLQVTLDRSFTHARAVEAVEEWLGPNPSNVVVDVEVIDDEVRVEVTGQVEPPSELALARIMNERVGRSIGVNVYWIPAVERSARIWDERLESE